MTPGSRRRGVTELQRARQKGDLRAGPPSHGPSVTSSTPSLTARLGAPAHSSLPQVPLDKQSRRHRLDLPPIVVVETNAAAAATLPKGTTPSSGLPRRSQGTAGARREALATCARARARCRARRRTRREGRAGGRGGRRDWETLCAARPSGAGCAERASWALRKVARGAARSRKRATAVGSCRARRRPRQSTTLLCGTRRTRAKSTRCRGPAQGGARGSGAESRGWEPPKRGRPSSGSRLATTTKDGAACESRAAREAEAQGERVAAQRDGVRWRKRGAKEEEKRVRAVGFEGARVASNRVRERAPSRRHLPERGAVR